MWGGCVGRRFRDSRCAKNDSWAWTRRERDTRGVVRRRSRGIITPPTTATARRSAAVMRSILLMPPPRASGYLAFRRSSRCKSLDATFFMSPKQSLRSGAWGRKRPYGFRTPPARSDRGHWPRASVSPENKQASRSVLERGRAWLKCGEGAVSAPWMLHFELRTTGRD